jgi:hypothetical protein
MRRSSSAASNKYGTAIDVQTRNKIQNASTLLI